MPNLIYAIVVSLFLILPDFITNMFFKIYQFTIYRFSREAIATFLIALILSFANSYFSTAIFSIFLLFAFISIVHYYYFHTYLMPYEVNILKNFDDVKDIFFSLYDVAALVVLLFFILLAATFIVYKLSQKTKKIKFFNYLFILALIIYPYFINKKKNIYLANFTHLSYFNTLNTLYLALLDSFKKKEYKEYKEYKVQKLNSSKKIVVVIMGESLNYKRMNLYGWNVNNTPLLNSLKNDKLFKFKKAISSSVRTITSVASFFYIKREPDNIKLLLTNKTNLVKLAKENGYKTYWISMQSDVSLISKIINFADYKKFEWNFKRKFDDELISELKKIDLSKKSFIILHLKAIHSPYNKYVPKEFQKFKEKNGYYNGVLYNDYVVYQIIDYLRKNAKDFSLYFTSDHGEMLGFKEEDYRYGHSQLVLGDCYVPFIYYGDKKLNKNFYSHYEIAKLIANDLGYKIINPNEDGSLYINGVEIDGSAGWIKYRLNNKVEIKEKR